MAAERSVQDREQNQKVCTQNKSKPSGKIHCNREVIETVAEFTCVVMSREKAKEVWQRNMRLWSRIQSSRNRTKNHLYCETLTTISGR